MKRCRVVPGDGGARSRRELPDTKHLREWLYVLVVVASVLASGPTLAQDAASACTATDCATCLATLDSKQKPQCAWCVGSNGCGPRAAQQGRTSMPGCEGQYVFRNVDECALVDAEYRDKRSDAYLEPRLIGWKPLGRPLVRNLQTKTPATFPPARKGQCYRVVLRARSATLMDRNKFRATIGLVTGNNSTSSSPEIMAAPPAVMVWDLGCPLANSRIELKAAPGIEGDYELQVYSRHSTKADAKLEKQRAEERLQLRLEPTCKRCNANRKRCVGTETQCLRDFIACVRANGHEPANCFIPQ